MTALGELAGLWGVQSSYTDVHGHRRRASREALLATLGALGVPVGSERRLRRAAGERRREAEGRLIEPVVVAWDGRLRLPAHIDGDRAAVTVGLEDGGGELRWTEARAGRRRAREDLPFGYHRLRVSVGGRHAEATVISAPSRSRPMPRTWGVFLPLYALHGRRSWGVGDVGDLRGLVRWVGGLGGGVVATTPLLAAFLDEPFEPGPYSPASRLFWNELFLDVTRVPDVAASTEGRDLMASLQPQVRRLRGAALVDHRRAMALKRRVLEGALRSLLSDSAERRAAFEAFVRDRPRLRDYARFRATRERDPSEDPYRYHLYAQWLLHQQLGSVHGEGARHGVSLCLDLPLGCHPAGYDVWRERGAFAVGASAGAPPDVFFAGGQEWGFPPPHPEGVRQDCYRYVRQCLGHAFSRAGVLRVDHMMSFHRLFWVPDGFDPRDGVYVRYRPDEMYAVLLLEAHRAGAYVLGEDLGTVPAMVRRSMDRHGVARSFALQTELGRGDLLPPAGAAAALNTHDMPTFESFRRGRDIYRRAAEGWLDDREADDERRRRSASLGALSAELRTRGLLNGDPEDRRSLVEACLADLGAGPAGVVLAGLEDLWLETEPHNVPGTVNGSNWRRRSRFSLEQFREMPEVLRPLRTLDRARRVS